MWRELEKAESLLNEVEVNIQKSHKVASTESESITSSIVETTSVSTGESNDRLQERDKLLSFTSAIGERISEVEEALKTANLDISYSERVRQELEVYARQVEGILNQLKTMDLSNDHQYSILQLVRLTHILSLIIVNPDGDLFIFAIKRKALRLGELM